MIGTLRAIARDSKEHLKKIGIDKITPNQLQKAALLGTVRIIRKYL